MNIARKLNVSRRKAYRREKNWFIGHASSTIRSYLPVDGIHSGWHYVGTASMRPRSCRGLARRLGRAARLQRLAERGCQQLLRLGGLPVAWSRVRVRVIGFGGHSQQD